MDSSYIDETTTTTTTTTTTSESPSVPLPMEITKSPISDKLCRMGSGTSVIIDAENGVEAESRKLPSSRFKGVVPQPNGRWGAQIYEKHQRVWLGTFNEEEEAAKAYDVAAQRFRGRDAITNFKLVQGTEESGLESVFLSSHSKAEIVDMLRKHTYNDELQQSRRSLLCNFVTGAEISINQSAKSSEPLFEKTVTPSDVGKLNRLVIPKQHAERHFPLQNGNNSKGVLLNFEDVGGKVWRFRYSYWNSSQSYVLTKGWSRFVKEKGLKAGDIVTFMRSIGSDNQQLYIDWKERSRTGSVISGSAIPGLTVEPVQMFRLFGVNIAKGALVDSNKNGGLGFKRRREMELFEFDLSKKIKVINAL